MRIISGTEKGRKLFTPPPHVQSIRPTSDKAREAVFSILGAKIFEARVLDLFAGTGAVGLEALSRSASVVIFIENNRRALDLIKKNIELCLPGNKGRCQLRVIQHDLTKGLPLDHLPPRTSRGFDVIFADPPYTTGLSLLILQDIDTCGILRQDGIFIVEERFDVQLPETLTHLRVVDRRVYGENAFWFYQLPTPRPASGTDNTAYSPIKPEKELP